MYIHRREQLEKVVKAVSGAEAASQRVSLYTHREREREREIY